MKRSIIFLDGQLLRADQGLLTRLAPWHLSGRGVFETMRVEDGVILFFPEHWRRLTKSLKILRITIPYSRREMEQQLRFLLALNPWRQVRMRLTIWNERNKMHISMIAAALERSKQETFRVGVHRKKMQAMAPSRRIKSIDYQFFLAAYQAVRRRGFDEAVILNQRNEVAEASRSNVFVVKDSGLLTPSLVSGGLNGITRQIVLRLARQKGMKIKETRLYLQDLQTAAEFFLTSSINGVVPVVGIGEHQIADGRRGPWTQRLQAAYRGQTNV